MGKVLLSLCIPTNGVLEWVMPVLKSIYDQSVSREAFEVIVTDNGNDSIFNKKMMEFELEHENFCYKKTIATGFLNQIEAFNLATGIFLKFINHRMPLVDGTLQFLISFIEKNHHDKPIVYFSNGVLKSNSILEYDSFEQFVLNLSYYSSWSAGLGVWKEHFKRINLNPNYNALFPHLYILFYYRQQKNYIINDMLLFNILEVNEKFKGKYDLFYAFAVEYPSQILDLFRSGDITIQTFVKLKKDILQFLTDLYIDYVLRKKPNSYDLTSCEDSLSVYYDLLLFKCHVLKRLFIKFLNKIVHL